MGDTEIRQTDIVFECPSCGKSLAVDERGAGLVVNCPQCAEQVLVPERDPADEAVGAESFQNPQQIQMLVDSLGDSQKQVRELSERLALSQKQYHHLEGQRSTYLAKLERIGNDVAIIQSALDRIVDALQSAPDRDVPLG